MILSGRNFRFHRGGYAESMSTTVSFSGRAELEAIVGGPVKLRHSVLDSRNGWDTWIVLTPSGDVIGFTDGDCD